MAPLVPCGFEQIDCSCLPRKQQDSTGRDYLGHYDGQVNACNSGHIASRNATIHKLHYRPDNHRPLPPRYDLDELHGTTARRLSRTEVLLPRTRDPFAMLQIAHDPGTSQPLLVNCNPAI
jgi:hypothetical protein